MQSGVIEKIRIISKSMTTHTVKLSITFKYTKSGNSCVVVNELLEKGEPLVLPDGFPQEKQLVEEQLQVLKSLQISGTKVVASGSKTDTSNAYKRREKTTCFVPNTQKNDDKKSGDNLTMLEKLQIAAPYYLFFTRIPESPETLKQTNSIQITGLLSFFFVFVF